jgi:hypothetical protein
MHFVTTLPAPANAIGLVDGNGNGLPDALFATSAGRLPPDLKSVGVDR